MLIKISDNLIVNTDHIVQVYGSKITMVNGDEFKLDDIGMRNMHQVAEAMANKLFKENNTNDLH